MKRIDISDNFPKEGKFLIGDHQEYKDLLEIADERISSLHDRFNGNILFLPDDLEKSPDKIGREYICELSAKGVLSTGNILGFVGVGQTRLKIHSRFDDAEGQDYFLHHMLERVFQIHLMNLPFSFDNENVFDFLVFFFPMYLKRALCQGLYREYRTFDHDDANLRGPIDFTRHIRSNIPFNGRIAYRTREHSTDNNMTQLIRHTVEYITSRGDCRGILHMDADTKKAVDLIVRATPTYSRAHRAQVVARNLRPSIHPYYDAYAPLQRLCIQILRHQDIRYGDDNEQVYGLVIDGSWLWEEYLARLLPCEFVHPQNRLRKGGLTMIQGNSDYRVYPDFYISGSIVLDAKYKRLEDKKYPYSEDLHQINSYMKRLHATKGGLLFPSTGQYKTGTNPDILEDGMGELYALALEIPQESGSYREFKKKMEKNENDLVAKINSVISNDIYTPSGL